jgi:hypothetical protein
MGVCGPATSIPGRFSATSRRLADRAFASTTVRQGSALDPQSFDRRNEVAHSGVDDGALLQAVSRDEKVKIALKPESIAIGKRDGGNCLTAHVTDRRHQST